MGNKIYTVFQNLEKTIGGNWNSSENSIAPKSNTYDMTNSSDVIFRTKDKAEFLQKKLELKQQKYLSNMWRNTSHNLSMNALNGLSAVKMMYRDVELMSEYPEIGAALDLYADEACLGGDTKIKLLNGKTYTIKELYEQEAKDFWCYTVDVNQRCKATKIKKIISKGKQKVCEILLDDGTKIKCTLNHKFLDSNGKWVEAKDLVNNTSLMSIYNRIVGKGYEQIRATNEKNYEYTHIMVANQILLEDKNKLKSKGSQIPNDKIVVHHKSFDKLNNDPNYLQFMYWSEHQKLHYQLNTERWKNEAFANEMRKKLSDSAKKFWENTDSTTLKKYIERRRLTLCQTIRAMSVAERKKHFGRNGKQNYFYGKKQNSENSYRFNFNKAHVKDINIDEYTEWLLTLENQRKNKSIEKLAIEKYNLVSKEVGKLHKIICEKFDIKNIGEIIYSKANINLFNVIKTLVQDNNSLDEISSKINITKYKIRNIIKNFGYNSFNDFKKSAFNHKVVSVTECLSEEEVYDLVDSSINNSFAICCERGYIISHNCTISSKGTLINVYSQSDRIKSIIEDLLVNRLDIQVTAPMIIRAMCKYGNQFMLLNINNDKGVVGWRQLPVSEIERREDGMQNMYTTLTNNTSEETTTFTWVGAQQSVTDFRNWQVGHFRLLTDSVFLPYGVSLLNKARRHWRILSLMEDMMLIYRLERSIERRVYKIYVGAIDDADVPAYIEEIANNFKRTPIIDPMTGQIDLRKNILPVWRKTPIPLIDGRTITIEDLADEFANGKTNYVYSVQDSSLKNTIGKVVWCGKNYTANTMLKIWIDDKFYMVMAHEHEVILRNGAKKRADMLKIGDRLLSFLLDDCCHYNSLCDTVTKIEEIEGDDVYCMTVEGENHEQDRHNFGLQLFSEGDIPVNEGVYVSNCTDQDVFIPVRDPNTPNPIDTLAAAQNLTAIDDIKYIQNKVLAGLRIPKSFLNFEESTGDGKNLALMDVRFARVIVRIQQAFLMELTKIVTIHLYLLGFKDDLTNFTLSMNNPSTQAEQLELENLSKKITTVRDAVSDPGNGLPVMSMTRALKEIMKWSDSEIKANLEEIRLEKALSAEIEKTSQIIKRTGLFDTVDKIYGEPGAEYQEDQGGMMDNGQGDFAGGGSGGLGGGFGDDLNTAGDIGSDDSGDLSSVEGTEPTSDMNNNGEALPTSNNNQPMESKRRNRILIEHQAFDNLIAKIDNTIKLNEQQKEITINKKLLMNDKYSEIIQDLDKFTK